MLINDHPIPTRRLSICLALLTAIITGQAIAEISPEDATASKPYFVSAFAGIEMTAAVGDNAAAGDLSSVELETWTHMEASLWEGQCGDSGLSYVYGERDVFLGYRCN